MFDKNLFDRNAFDRSVSSNAISLFITTSSSLTAQLLLRSSLGFKTMSGGGNMTCGLVMRQHINASISGNGTMVDFPITLRMSLGNVKLSGSGSLSPRLSIQTPFRGNFNGVSTMLVDNRMHLLQYLQASLSGAGTFSSNIMLQTSLEPINLFGSSILQGSISFPLPIGVHLSGSSELVLRRLSAINENILELIGINLLPGETVTIDTDLLQVLFGSREDVSSVTSESVFFELNPGENEIVVSTDTNQTLDVTAIWQNRWL